MLNAATYSAEFTGVALGRAKIMAATSTGLLHVWNLDGSEHTTCALPLDLGGVYVKGTALGLVVEFELDLAIVQLSSL